MTNKIKLRPHHFNAFLHPDVENSATQECREIMYGSEMADKLKIITDNLHSETLVEIVEGLDDMCKSVCPYLKYCENKQYGLMRDNIIKNLEGTKFYDDFIMGITELNPNEIDQEELEALGFESGKTYTWKEITKRYEEKIKELEG